MTGLPPVVSPHVRYIPSISSHSPLKSDGVTGAWYTAYCTFLLFVITLCSLKQIFFWGGGDMYWIEIL